MARQMFFSISSSAARLASSRSFSSYSFRSCKKDSYVDVYVVTPFTHRHLDVRLEACAGLLQIRHRDLQVTPTI